MGVHRLPGMGHSTRQKFGHQTCGQTRVPRMGGGLMAANKNHRLVYQDGTVSRPMTKNKAMTEYAYFDVAEVVHVELRKSRPSIGAATDSRGRYYTIHEDDEAKFAIYCFGHSWPVTDFIGRILAQDVGKRVYLRGGILQVENDEQRHERERKEAKNERA